VFVIEQATDPAALIRAWHTRPTDVYDFNTESQRIEVKSASGRVRQHQFALTQLQPPPDTHVLIASVLMEQAGAGTALSELIESLQARLAAHPELVIQLDRMVFSTLGNTWRRALESRYDRAVAKTSLQFYNARVIPGGDVQLPSSISNVHFTANLTGLAHVTRKELRAARGLFAAVVPR